MAKGKKNESSKNLELTGVHVFATTPTDAEGAIAPKKIKDHADFMITSGIKSYTVFGSTGGIGSFNEDERRVVAEAAMEAIDGRIPVIVGAGSITTAEAVRLSIHAREIGAAAVVVVPMAYWPLTENELLSHYRAIADASGMPMILYNNPRTTGVDMSPAFLSKLARKVPNVIGVKQSAPDVSRIAEIIRETGGEINVLTGRDAQALEAFSVGAAGWFSGGANYMPKLCVRLFDLFNDGSIDEARDLFDKTYPLTSFTSDRGGIRCAHTALDLMNRSMGHPRAPVAMLGKEDTARLAEYLKENNILR